MKLSTPRILLVILGVLIAGFVASALTFIHASASRGVAEYPFSPLDGSAGPTLFTMMAIPSTISVLVYMQLYAHKWRTALALASLAAGLVTFFFIGLFIIQTAGQLYPLDNQYVYTPSDITKANPNLTMARGDFSMLADIEQTKDSVLFTVYGEILKVGDPIPWTDEAGNSLASIPVHMVIKNVSKDTDPDMNLKLDDEFVFYLSGGYEQDITYVDAFEPQFEIGEDVILHIGKADDAYGPMNDLYYVKIGMYGKYKVVDGKAYNENYPTGKLLNSVFDEAK